MKYEEPEKISYEEAINVFRKNDSKDIAKTIISLALYHKDASCVEKWCLFWCNTGNLEVSMASIVAVGHLARIHREITKEVILPVLALLEENEDLQGVIADALDDIEIYCK